jgi:PAS domain S-box-containing protein
MAKIELPSAPENSALSTMHADRLPNMDAFAAGLGQLKDIIDFLPDATFVIDKTGKVIAWNKAIEKVSGMRKEEIIGKGDYSYAIPFYGKPRPVLIDFVPNQIAAGAGEYDFVTKDGDVLFCETFVPNAYGGEGAYVWGAAAALYDCDKNLIGAIESIRDISSRKRLEQSLLQREKELEEKARQMEEINTALRVLLKNREEDQKKLENHIQSNLKELILPYLDRMKKGRLDQNQQAYLELIESSLEKILSPFITSMNSAFNLSPMEIPVANLIKEGKTSKEIASLLCIAYKTVETHRYNLRMKLGIQNEKINLRSYLLSIK